MESPRILAAALALDHFTAAELAAHSDAKLATVRAAIDRHPDWFVQVDGLARPQGRGRPANRYRVEAETVRSTLGADMGNPLPSVDDPETTRDEDQLLMLQSADRTLARAYAAADEDDRALLARLAIQEAGRAIALDVDGTTPPRRAQAEMIQALAALMPAPTPTPTPAGASAFGRAANALAVAASLFTESFVATSALTVLLDAARVHHESPPIAIVTDGDEPLSAILDGIAPDEWSCYPLVEERGCVWAPKWAEALASQHLFAGVVLDFGEDDLDAALRHVRAWDVPMLVKAHDPSAAVQSRAFELGASVLPTADMSHAVSWFGETLVHYSRGRRNLFASLDVRA